MLDDNDKQWIDERLQQVEERLVEHMRDMQSEILRGFEELLEIEKKLGL